MDYNKLNNYIINDPKKQKNKKCESCGLDNIRTYFICENKGCVTCYGCMIRYNGYRICPKCLESITKFPKTASSTDNLFSTIFGNSKNEKIVEASIIEDDRLIDEIAGTIISLLNEDNNINIVDGKLSSQSVRDIKNSVISLISHPDI